MSSHILLVGAVLIPLATALLIALFSRSKETQRVLAFVGASAYFLSSYFLLDRVIDHGKIRLGVGGYSLPFAIEFAADGLSALMVMITALVLLLILIFQESDADPAPLSRAFYPLLFMLITGVSGSFITADLFNLYVFFEIMLLAGLGLLAHGGTLKSFDATIKYFVLNAVGTAFFLFAIGLIYASTGHLNYTALTLASELPEGGEALAIVLLLGGGFLVKAGAFPVFSWLPSSYPTLPVPVLALFAGLLTKVGVYALLRFLVDVFPLTPSITYEVLGHIASVTMIVGAVGAIYHYDMRRILAFHIVSQVGYMLLAIALGTKAAFAGAIFYTLHHILAKTNLFLVSATVAKLTGYYDLRRTGGLYGSHPMLGLLFLIPALAMVGVPPLSGFWAKFIVLREGLTGMHYLWVSAAVITGFLTLYSMMKIWFEAFLKRRPGALFRPDPSLNLAPAYIAIALFSLCTVVMGLFPEGFLAVIERSIDTLAIIGGEVPDPYGGLDR